MTFFPASLRLVPGLLRDRVSCRRDSDGSVVLCRFVRGQFRLWRVGADALKRLGLGDFSGRDASALAPAVLRPARYLGTLHSVRGRPERPFEALIRVTARCNRACGHCFVDHGDARAELSVGQWGEVFARLSANGVLSVHLTGGEPLVRGDIADIVGRATSAGLRVALDTNGAAAGPGALDALACAGLDALNIGMDGSCPAVYGLSRDGRDHEAAVRAAAMAAERGVAVVFFFCLHRGNAGDFLRLRRLARRLGVARISIDPYQPGLSGGGRGMIPLPYPARVVFKLLALTLNLLPGPRVGWDTRCNMGLVTLTLHQDGAVGLCPACACVFSRSLPEDIGGLWGLKGLAFASDAAFYGEPCRSCRVPGFFLMRRFMSGKCLFDCRSEVFRRTGDVLAGNTDCVVERFRRFLRPWARRRG